MTAERKYKIRKWTALGVIAAIVLTAGGYGIFYWYNATHLLVTNTRPTDSVASSATDVVFWFNKPISPDAAKNFSISPAVKGKTTVTGNSLTFTPDTTFNEDDTYTATVSHVTSEDGVYSHGDIKLKFKIGYVPYDKLPKEIQERGLKLTDDQPTELGYFGADNLTGQGVTSGQLVNVEKILKEVFDSTPLTDYAINIGDVSAAPFDSNSSDPAQTYNFYVEINDVTYKAILNCKVMGDARLRLYNPKGALVKDSGSMKSDEQVDDSNL